MIRFRFWAFGVGHFLAATISASGLNAVSVWGLDACSHHFPHGQWPELHRAIAEAGLMAVRQRTSWGLVSADDWNPQHPRSLWRELTRQGFVVYGFSANGNEPYAEKLNRAQLGTDLLEVWHRQRQQAEWHRGCLSVWELLNEPEVFIRDLPDQVAAFQKAVYLGLKAGDPAARVIGPSLAFNPTHPYWDWMVRNRMWDYAEGHNFHYYGWASAWSASLEAQARFAAHLELTTEDTEARRGVAVAAPPQVGGFAAGARSEEFKPQEPPATGNRKPATAALPPQRELFITEYGTLRPMKQDLDDPVERHNQAVHLCWGAAAVAAAPQVGGEAAGVRSAELGARSQKAGLELTTEGTGAGQSQTAEVRGQVAGIYDLNAVSCTLPAAARPSTSHFTLHTSHLAEPPFSGLPASSSQLPASAAPAVLPSPLVLQWRPAARAAYGHKVSGSYRFYGRADGSLRPITGVIRAWNLSQQPQAATVWVRQQGGVGIETEFCAAPVPVGADSNYWPITVPPLGFVDLPLVFTPPAVESYAYAILTVQAAPEAPTARKLEAGSGKGEGTALEFTTEDTEARRRARSEELKPQEPPATAADAALPASSSQLPASAKAVCAFAVETFPAEFNLRRLPVVVADAPEVRLRLDEAPRPLRGGPRRETVGGELPEFWPEAVTVVDPEAPDDVRPGWPLRFGYLSPVPPRGQFPNGRTAWPSLVTGLKPAESLARKLEGTALEFTTEDTVPPGARSPSSAVSPSISAGIMVDPKAELGLGAPSAALPATHSQLRAIADAQRPRVRTFMPFVTRWSVDPGHDLLRADLRPYPAWTAYVAFAAAERRQRQKLEAGSGKGEGTAPELTTEGTEARRAPAAATSLLANQSLAHSLSAAARPSTSDFTLQTSPLAALSAPQRAAGSGQVAGISGLYADSCPLTSTNALPAPSAQAVRLSPAATTRRGDLDFFYKDYPFCYARENRSGPWDGINGLTVRAVEDPALGDAVVELHTVYDDPHPQRHPLATCKINGLPRAGFIRLVADADLWEPGVDVRVDLIDVWGRAWSIFEQCGRLRSVRGPEKWLRVADFHHWFHSNADPELIFVPEAIREIQLTVERPVVGARHRVGLSFWVPEAAAK